MTHDDKKLWGAWGQANALYSAWAAAKGVNYYLLFVLYALDGEGKMTQKKICDQTGLTKQTVNSVVRLLRMKELVALSSGTGDRREKVVALTGEGAAYAKELLAPLYDLERAVLSLMGEERVRELVEAISLYNTVFEKEMEKKLK